jgi:hypothetical protein
MEIRKNVVNILEDHLAKRSGFSIFVNCKNEEDAMNEISEIENVMGKGVIEREDLNIIVTYDKMRFVLILN